MLGTGIIFGESGHLENKSLNWYSVHNNDFLCSNSVQCILSMLQKKNFSPHARVCSYLSSMTDRLSNKDEKWRPVATVWWFQSYVSILCIYLLYYNYVSISARTETSNKNLIPR